ncbi:two-component hybrid sensor and regulator [Calothrix sp. NIES-2100]|uniref:hybrid sensor histidine kinase/response regulator n=1 Tax=Calothrix sp. NIES-2100 TaxID=1954172 RepID=UPI000B5DBB0B|nr:two-component hybrid sensor and regulator [Calothrix sp. NIES-2100]
MLPEQQQRILGYFIEEARDHLNTIEQGLLNLQGTLNDPEMINEVFRAAHSIKGGAAMLGLNSIQHTSHRLEDCFKILKENPIQVDQKLESLFLGVADTLKALLENLSGPYGLSEETANTLMSETEPVFQWLNQHLELLVDKANSGDNSFPVTERLAAVADHDNTLTAIFMHRDFSEGEEDDSSVSGELFLTSPPETIKPVVAQEQQNWSEFQTQVLQTLREMLQLFKQGTTSQTRQNLQQCCQQLVRLGEAFNLPKWCNLCQAATNAIANPENTYLTLAKIVITEIKTAQELVLKGKDAEITISQQLEVLLSFPEVELFDIANFDLPDESAPQGKAIAFELPSTNNDVVSDSKNSITNLSELSKELKQEQAILPTKDRSTTESPLLFNSLSSNEDNTLLTNDNLDPKGPEVGIAELNTLADLFEGETPELDETWQQEEILDINAASKLGIDISSNDSEDADSDIADLLSFDNPQNTIIQAETFQELFADNSQLEPKNLDQHSQTATTKNDLNLDSPSDESIEEFTDLLLEYPGDIAPEDVVQDLLGLALSESEITPPENEVIALTEISPHQISNFPELFSENVNENLEEKIPLVGESKHKLPQPESFSLDNLFTEQSEHTPLSPGESDIGDLFDTPPTIAKDFSLSADDDLSTFWNEAAQTEQQLQLDSALDQDVAKALEESLFTAANEFLTDTSSILPSLPGNFDLEDFDRTFLQTDEQIKLLLSSDSGIDLFAELSPTNTTISPVVDDQEVSDTEISSFLQEQSAYTLIPSTALPPEPLDFTPEFTNQVTENPFVNSDKSVTDLENDLFNIDSSELNLIADESAAIIEMSFGNLDTFETPETIVAETRELNLVADESTDGLDELNFEGLDDFETPETIVAEPPELNLVADESTASLDELNFGELDSVETPETIVAETRELNLVADESTASLDELNFGELDSVETPETIVAETRELNLVADESTDGLDELNFEGLDDFETPETIVAETPELNLVTDESTASIDELNFGELDSVETPETIVAETRELNLVTDESTASIDELNFGELDSVETPETIVAETPELNLVADESTDGLDELNFEGLDDFETPETIVAEPPELNLVADESTASIDELNFGELDSVETPETIVAETRELNLVADESTASLDELNFGELDSVETPETIVAETPELNLVADESAATLDFNFAEPSSLQQSQANSNLDESLVTAVSKAENTVAESAELSLVDELSENILQEYANLEDLLENVTELKITQTTEATTIAEEDNNVVANNQLEVAPAVAEEDEFADLESLLNEEFASPIPDQDFAALEALLDGDKNEEVAVAPPPVYPQQLQPPTTANNVLPEIDDEFGDLEKLLAEADQTISHSPSIKSNTGKTPRSAPRRGARFEETMKVPVKQLDDMSNLVGELVVNRNTLEQDQERLRQSLDNLLIQIQLLSDVGARMQELYERSLLEASLLASRKTRDSGVPSYDSNSDRGFSELEMDRFTPFHTLSQEMIEMIVRVRESASDIDFVTEETERVARQFRQVTTQLQEGLTRARMVPFSQAIDRLRRGVRDNAIKYGKQVELVIEGGDTLIDKMILDHLTDPLTHMLNNAIAHGIETPQVRQASGKQPVGEIKIRAFHQGNQTVISVGDDGAGIDTERIKAKALKLGMLTAEQAKTITRPEIYDLLFQAGFSIKDQADEISGRGVGMDVVRSEISEIRGIVNTDSTLGKGTTFTIRLPLTLSICKALCCVSDRARIAFPMDGVEDTLDIPVKNIQETADGQSYISWRDTVLPFRPLKDILAFNRQLSRGNVYGGTRDDDMVSVVVVRSANNLIALQIDQVLSEQEIVIKQFEGPAPKPLGVAGATVLGDGRIMPIADVLEIIDIFQGRMSKQNGGIWQHKTTPPVPEITAVKIDPTVLIVDDSITVRELLSLTFNKAGYRVEQARDGQEAWDKLRSGLPCDIVFCDIEMPRCDGLELLSRIQKDHNLNQLPIAMLTSRGADKHRQMAIQLGASGYFTKPYLEEALLEAAVRMLKGEKLIHSTGA